MAVAAREEAQAQRRESFAADAERRMTEMRKDNATVIGCYAVSTVLEEVVVTSVAAGQSKSVARQRASTSTAGAPAPAAAPAQKTADKSASTVLIRLDTGNVVRRATVVDSVGVWQAVSGDSARVTFGGRTLVVGQSSKVRCP